MDKKPNRYYSKIQENSVAKALGGKTQPNSGARTFAKGDCVTDCFAIECKTSTTNKKSVAIKKEWLTKIEHEAFSIGKSDFALAFNFGPKQPNYYIISEDTFKRLNEFISEVE